jgi:hypothetical protein
MHIRQHARCRRGIGLGNDNRADDAKRCMLAGKVDNDNIEREPREV